VKVSQKIS